MFFSCYLSTLIYTFHVKCRVKKRHKCKLCDSTYYLFFNIYGKYVCFSTRLRNMATRLTWLQEKKLQNCLGGKQFSLLYRASVCGFSDKNLFSKCYCQGPILIVIYSSDHVLGIYIPQNEKNKTRVSCFLFAFEGTEILGCKIGPGILGDFLYHYSTKRELKIDLPNKKVNMSLDTIEKLKLSQHQTMSFEECEVFRCEGKFDYIILEFSSAC